MNQTILQKTLCVAMAGSILFSTNLRAAKADEEAPVLRAYTQTSDALDPINHKILQSELDLLKLNAEFRTHYTAGNKWMNRRRKIYDFAAGGVANAGDITLMSQFWKYWKDPGAGLAHKGRLEAGPIIVLVAYCMLGTMYMGEECYDLLNDYKAKRKGFDAKSVYKRALASKEALDKLFQERETAIANETNETTKQFLIAEGNVLKDIRDLSLIEFSQLYIDARKARVARDLTNLGTFAVCATGAFPGAYGVTKGIKDVNIKEVGGGGIGFLVSGTILTAAPALIHGGAAVAGSITKENMEKNLWKGEGRAIGTLEKDVDAMRQMASNAGAEGDYKACSTMAKLLRTRYDYWQKEKQRHKIETIENFISYAAKGGPQIAWGTMLTHTGYTHFNDPVRAFKGVAQAATVNEVSWGIWLLDTLQTGGRQELANYRAGKLSPAQGAFTTTNAELVQLESALK